MNCYSAKGNKISPFWGFLYSLSAIPIHFKSVNMANPVKVREIKS